MSNWKPIKTAPRDGTMVDIWVSFMDHAGRVRKKGPDGRFPDARWLAKQKKWCDINNTYFTESPKPPKAGTLIMIVTHWMPRPKHPTE